MNRKLKLQELGRLTPEAYKSVEKTPLIIVLDNIRSLNNIGSVFRTADAFRLEAVYLCGYTARPPHRDINKTALGATETVEWHYFESAEEALLQLKNSGYSILSIEQTQAAVSLSDFHPAPKQSYAIILGNEVEGVQQKLIDLSDTCLEIPQYGTKHSLNVSVCTGIVVWDLFDKMKKIGQ